MVNLPGRITCAQVDIPLLSETQRAEIQDFLVEAARGGDEEGQYIVRTLLNAVMTGEAALRKAEATLSRYRSFIPRLCNITSRKAKEV